MKGLKPDLDLKPGASATSTRTPFLFYHTLPSAATHSPSPLPTLQQNDPKTPVRQPTLPVPEHSKKKGENERRQGAKNSQLSDPIQRPRHTSRQPLPAQAIPAFAVLATPHLPLIARLQQPRTRHKSVVAIQRPQRLLILLHGLHLGREIRQLGEQRRSERERRQETGRAVRETDGHA